MSNLQTPGPSTRFVIVSADNHRALRVAARLNLALREWIWIPDDIDRHTAGPGAVRVFELAFTVPGSDPISHRWAPPTPTT
ncbi:hypothetical protein ATJ78_2140 [Paramicrobacterium agarici]|uniref:Uncharacterized protein n=1 Tax=Paramicrobacterium agarici TaxID=630514 RepID=A0A2A9DYH2_9MICO|nr:hypothetical protein ATJ78_2140 [Microbacterium agarici]